MSTSSVTSSLTSVLQSGALASIGGSSPSSGNSNLAITGLASGLNWSTVIQELANAERAPETQWRTTQTQENNQNAAYATISNDLGTLQLDIQALQDPTLYASTVASSSSPGVATANAGSGTAVGTYAFNISSLATAAQMNGTASISNVLAPGGDTSAVTLGTAGFSTPITAGTITVNGAQITISQSDSLQQVFDNIASATGNAVTASYNSTSDEITLTGTGPITLGSAADTSNFLQVAQLYNNGTNTITSNSALGRVNPLATMASSNLKTAISDGGSGNGQFTINGVTFNFNAGTDTIQNVLNNINESAANVTASYDSVNNRFVLANKTTGDVGVAMQDVTGNFLAATGLSGGTLQRGQNLAYTLNGGSQTLYSQSNTISSSSSGINGLTLNALSTGTTTVSISSDTNTMSSDIQKFVSDYNAVQSFITSQMKVTNNADGSTSPGLLTGDQTASQIASDLRNLVTSVVSVPGMDGQVGSLNDMGIVTNGNDNTIAVSDASALASALSNHLNDVKTLFSDSTSGLAVQFGTFITNTIGNNGTVPNHQAVLTQDSANITTQISNLEQQITNDTNKWTTEFQKMETAESQTNQELTYLSQAVANGSL